ncbi:sodium-dependent bicarbonate transport family permease [Thiocapsa imhoffii]|uniref:Sodium-dependent bicarbonate transport family permease n=1 Tax=Thiocapsa imhoffii TaxID=382777 RepID=A0A9X1BB60_9GAMM|nr:sodium-dependent bicarbonate transport family permease [Thiocapsa imhoffii]MBK1646460.1 sodium-dependent bicarbonate transport family permease [Thiocapsa imhoffii]
MSAFSNLLIPAVLFFALGFFARLIKSDLRFPPDLAKILSIYLLVSIGLHGGMELANANLGEALVAVIWALVLGLLLPVIGYALLIATRRVAPLDAAAIAAHYGSVSAGTFLTAIAFLGTQGVEYERYPLIMLAVMESPAIVVGLLLASWTRRRAVAGGSLRPADEGEPGNGGLGEILREAFTNGSVVLLVGSMLIGAIANPNALEALDPFTADIFMGMLCLFLLEMGLEAGRRFGDFRRVGLILGGFGVVMPLIGGVIGLLVGHFMLGFSVGGTTLVAVLGASASYIAVPPAMRLAIPEANPSLYLTLSLGVTFPFNVVFGIPIYHHLAVLLAGWT